MEHISTVATMTLDGGAACLDLVNSGYDRRPDEITERLHNYPDLLTLVSRLELLTADQIQALKSSGEKNEAEAAGILMNIRQFRALLYRFFAALTKKSIDNLDEHTLTDLNRYFADALIYRQLQVVNGALQFMLKYDQDDLSMSLQVFVLSAYDLFRTANLNHIRQCSGCAWFFYDQTKNHRKKWCSMASCGNSQKTKGYYERKKSRSK